MSAAQKTSTTALLPVLVLFVAFCHTALSAETTTASSTDTMTASSTNTTTASTGANSSVSLNTSSLLGQKERPCGEAMSTYCHNGGQCVFYQDQSDKPSCKCVPPFEGERCLMISTSASKCQAPDIFATAMIFGATAFLGLLAVVLLCCLCRRCVKSAPLKASAPEISV